MYVVPPAIVAPAPCDQSFEANLQTADARVEFAAFCANAELRNLHTLLLSLGRTRAAAAVAAAGFELSEADLAADPVAGPGEEIDF